MALLWHYSGSAQALLLVGPRALDRRWIWVRIWIWVLLRVYQLWRWIRPCSSHLALTVALIAALTSQASVSSSDAQGFRETPPQTSPLQTGTRVALVVRLLSISCLHLACRPCRSECSRTPYSSTRDHAIVTSPVDALIVGLRAPGRRMLLGGQSQLYHLDHRRQLQAPAVVARLPCRTCGLLLAIQSRIYHLEH